MSSEVLLAHPDHSWHEWIRQNLGDRDLICLDPGLAEYGWPARVSLVSKGKVKRWCFVGTLNARLNPLGVQAGFFDLYQQAENPLILLFPIRSAPVLRQLALSVAQAARPSRILAPLGCEGIHDAWPVGPEEIEVTPTFPQIVFNAQRHSQWVDLLGDCKKHEIDLMSVRTQGARLGGGELIDLDGFSGWAEKAGSMLHVVTPEMLEDKQAQVLAHQAEAAKVNAADPSSYKRLICSFAHENGEDYAMGVIHKFDPIRGSISVLAAAEPPSPVRILRIGTLRIGPDGKEMGEAKPWSV